MLTKKEIAYWARTESLREQFTVAYWRKFQRSIYVSVLPIIKNIERLPDLDAGSYVIGASSQDESKLIKTLSDLYVQVGTTFGLKIRDEILGKRKATDYEFGVDTTVTNQDITQSLLRQAMADFAAGVGASKVRSISATNRRILNDIMKAAIEAGWGAKKTARIMRAFFQGELSASRAIMIARTETMSASSFATEITGQKIEELGIKLRKRWIPTPHGKFRPTHLAMSGQPPILFTDYFLVGGVSMKHPHDATAPASEVINCRCSQLLIPI